MSFQMKYHTDSCQVLMIRIYIMQHGGHWLTIKKINFMDTSDLCKTWRHVQRVQILISDKNNGNGNYIHISSFNGRFMLLLFFINRYCQCPDKCFIGQRFWFCLLWYGLILTLTNLDGPVIMHILRMNSSHVFQTLCMCDKWGRICCI